MDLDECFIFSLFFQKTTESWLFLDFEGNEEARSTTSPTLCGSNWEDLGKHWWLRMKCLGEEQSTPPQIPQR